MIVLLFFAAASAAALDLSLEEAWDLAATAPGAELATAAEAAGRAERIASRAYRNPDVSYTGFGRTRGTFDAINRQQHQLDVGLGLPVTGARAARRAVGEAAELAGLALGAQARAELAEEVALDWLDLLAAQERLAILADASARIEELLATTRLRVESGAARPYDADRIALAHASLDRRIAEEERDRSLAAARLAARLGRAGADVSATGDLTRLAGLSKEAGGEPAWLQRARLEQRRAEDALRVARRSRLTDPELRVGGYWTSEEDLGPLLPPAPQLPEGDSFSVVAGLGWELPVFDRGRGAVASAAAERAARDAELREAELRYDAETAALRGALDALRAALAEDRAAEAARLQAAAEVAYLEGESGVFELVDAVGSRVDTSLEQVDLWLVLRATELRLSALAGGFDGVIEG